MTGVLIKTGNLETDTHMRRTPCEDEGRDQGDVLYTKEGQKLMAKDQKLGERHGTDPPSQPS